MDVLYQWHQENQNWIRIKGFPQGKSGFFETFKFINKSLYFKEIHYKRYISTLNNLQLFSNIDFIQLLLVTENFLLKNNILEARVKIIFFPSDENVSSVFLQYSKLPFSYYYPSPERINLGIYEAEYLDGTSRIKSLERGVYNRAIEYATAMNFHDVLLFNATHQVIESTISNLFYIKNKVIYTPLLTHEGVEGVMKAYIMQQRERIGIQIIEKDILLQDLVEADEIFLSNVIRGLRPVENFMSIQKSITLTQEISQQLFPHNTTSTYV